MRLKVKMCLLVRIYLEGFIWLSSRVYCNMIKYHLKMGEFFFFNLKKEKKRCDVTWSGHIHWYIEILALGTVGTCINSSSDLNPGFSPVKLDQNTALKDFDILVAIKIHCFNHMKEKWAPTRVVLERTLPNPKIFFRSPRFIGMF